MEDEHLDTIPATESDKLIKSSVKNLVPIPSEFKGISEDTCDVPVCEDPSTFDALNDHFEILSDSNDDDTLSDDDDFEDIEYVSLEEVNDVDQEEKEFDLEVFFNQDVILREKLLNISRLVTNIESLTDNPTPDRVLKSSFSFPIPVTNSDSFFEETDISLSHLDNSLPEFETFFMSIPSHLSFSLSLPFLPYPEVSSYLPPPNVDTFLTPASPIRAGYVIFGITESFDTMERESDTVIGECQKPGHLAQGWDVPHETEVATPGHLAARLGCAETKVATWDDLSFKLIIFRWNVKHSMDIAKISRKRSKPDKRGHGKELSMQKPGECYQRANDWKNDWPGLMGVYNRLRGLEASPRQYKYKQGLTHKDI
ncbi:hypothetical protein Tco_0473048 [Tanacetum coccineum]